MNKIIKNRFNKVKESLNIFSFLKKLYLLYDYLFVAHVTKLQPKQSLKRSLILTLVVILFSLPLNWELLKDKNISLGSDNHSSVSLNIAVNNIVCKQLSRFAPTFNQFILSENSKILDEKVLDLPTSIASSQSEYCQSTNPFINNENTLGWLMEIVLRVFPNITVRQLGLALNSIKIGCLIILTFFLIWIGISPFIAFMTLNVGISVVDLVNNTHYYALYPFLMPFIILMIAILGIAIKLKAYKRVYIAVPVLLGIGIYGALFKNLRTSYYPVIIFCLLIYILFTIFELKVNRQISRIYRTIFPGLAILVFCAGVAIFNINLVHPIEKLNTGYNRSYHVIAHPLVLSLALPENKLSQREGIQWSDGVGLSLAHKIDPDVTYLDTNYEKALFTYYFKLWMYYPNEMVNIYWQKLKLAGSQIPDFIKKSDEINQFLLSNFFPLNFLSNGIITISIFLAISLLGFFLQRYFTPEFLFTLIGIFGAGLLLLLESAIIMPFFRTTHHNYLLFCFLVLSLALYQLLFNLLALLFQNIFKFIQKYSKVNP
ncbi:MAG: hypothetical protein F6K21_03755 [Symploca sp. SIO2D2]|nr:hypothetical protein [Symploca sp. SIO2D2]